MNSEASSTRTRLKAPKVAAIAEIVFSALLSISLILLLLSFLSDLRDGGVWLATRGNSILLALNLVPFAGIALLWFMGVVYDWVGEREDRFLITVFLGSGLLFLSVRHVSSPHEA